MGFRGKLALVFASLLIFAVSAISVMEFERTTRLMVSNLGDTGLSLAKQVYEQMRDTFRQPQSDPIGALRNDPAIASTLRSAQAFGKGVLYARIVGVDGSVIAGPPASPSESVAVHPFEELVQQSNEWFPWAQIRSLFSDRSYEISRPIEIN